MFGKDMDVPLDLERLNPQPIGLGQGQFEIGMKFGNHPFSCLFFV